MSPFNPADYEPVEDRLRAFWEEHPYGRIITELLSHEDGEYIVYASAYIGNELRNDPPAATGLASEFAGSSMVNKTSALENCETSAIGRALANLGYAPKGKRPSREEMSKTSLGSTRTPDGATSQTRAKQAPPEGLEPPAPVTATAPAPSGSESYGEGEAEPASKYLTKEDQSVLKVEYGSPALALKAYRARFGERITRLGDITYEMRDEMGGSQ